MLRKNKKYYIVIFACAVFVISLLTFFSFSDSFMNYTDLKPKVIKLDCPPDRERFGGIVAVEVNNDHIKELVITKKKYIGVYTIHGQRLWSNKADINLSEGGGWLPGSHGAGVQATDIDNDSFNELLYLTRHNQLKIIDGQSGHIIHNINLPPVFKDNNQEKEPIRWEHIIVANFQGRGDRDILLQATEATEKEGFRIGCYVAAYSIDDLLRTSNPKPLWFRDDYVGPAHGGARIADLNLDGRDEVIGATLLGPEGHLLYQIPVEEKPLNHIDAIHAADVRPDIPGIEVVALQETHLDDQMGNHIFLFGHKGLIWKAQYKHQEPQNAAIGDFLLDQSGLEIWCRSRFKEHQKPFVFNSKGKVLVSYELDNYKPLFWSDHGLEVISPIYWTGGEQNYAAAKERHCSGDIAIFNPISGKFIHRWKEKADRIFVADVMGDWPEEIMVLNANELHIYSNNKSLSKKNKKSLWSNPVYYRNKMNWNYYNP